MSLKASVAPQPAFGHPLLAPLVSTHASATQVSPPCEGGVVLAQPRTGLLKGILTGLASPRSSHLRENVRGVRSSGPFWSPTHSSGPAHPTIFTTSPPFQGKTTPMRGLFRDSSRISTES
jgi:hypothetical protein